MKKSEKHFSYCRYNSETGEFTVSLGGAGLYYFFVHVHCDGGEEVTIAIRQDRDFVCRAYAGTRDVVNSASCGAAVALGEGMSSSIHTL